MDLPTFIRNMVTYIFSHPTQPIFVLISFPTLFLFLTIRLPRLDLLTRWVFLFMFGGVAFLAFRYSGKWFPNAENGTMLHDYALNLSTQFFAALVIPFVYETLLKYERALIAFFIAVPVLMFGILLVLFKNQLLTVMDSGFSVSLGTELMGGMLTFLIVLLIWCPLKLVFNVLAAENNLVIFIRLSLLLMALLVLRVVLFFLLHQSSALVIDLLVTIFSMSMTLIIFTHWVTRRTWLLPVFSILVTAIATILLLFPRILGQDNTIGITGELVGALITTALLEKEWLWPE